MKTRIFRIILLIICSNSSNIFAQNNEKEIDVLGKYTTMNPSHTNQRHYEEIDLKSDSTFKYYAKIGEFVKQRIEGKWTVDDNNLILNGTDKNNEKLKVYEYYDSSIADGWIKFNVQHFNNTLLNYRVSAVNDDYTIILSNQFQSSLIQLAEVDEFFIEGSLFRYPTYHVKDKSSNFFDVKVSSKRLFVDEKWLIEGEGRIRPIGLDNEYTGYFLSRAIK